MVYPLNHGYHKPQYFIASEPSLCIHKVTLACKTVGICNHLFNVSIYFLLFKKQLGFKYFKPAGSSPPETICANIETVYLSPRPTYV